MQPVTIYTKSWCGFCHAAKRLLTEKGVDFVEHDVEAEPGLRAEVVQRSGRTTVPQIWIGETHVGGYDDLSDLERRGRLDLLLEG